MRFLCLVLLLLTGDCLFGQDKAPGLGDPGRLVSIVIETGRGKEAFQLAGRDAGQQLLITGHYATGQVRDLTRTAKISVRPAGIIAVDDIGYVSALKEGVATIEASVGATQATIEARVTDIERDLPVHFANEVVPILTRFGCNAGGCHGKSGGQNGFQLSLLGFEAREDYDYLTRESKGRRILFAAPEHSLLLTKATGEVAHGGGKRLARDSAAYRLLLRWVAQGAPLGRASDATVTRIEVVPGGSALRLLPLDGSQQLAVVAHFSNGTTRDVTRLAQFATNNADIATVSDAGLVTVNGVPGSVAVMVRFQIHVDVFRAAVPLGVAKLDLPAPANFIDEQVFAQLKKLGLPPSPVCDDATFLRRVTIDIAGRLPSVEEAEAFLKDSDAARREKLVDRLLASDDYADYFALKWNAVLRNKRASPKSDPKPHVAFHGWIREHLRKNAPFNLVVKALLTATGEEIANPPVTWYREVKDVFTQVEDTAQLFLGTRLGCARCHHHPQEKWAQRDYYALAAFFARVDYLKPPPLKKGEKKPKDAPLVHVLVKEGHAILKHPRTDEAMTPTVLDGKPASLPADMDPRVALADWVVSKDNPFFARTLANRYWKHFLGRGLVEPEDDMRLTNPASNPELLDALAKHVLDTGYDLKKLVRAICVSKTYQLSSTPNAHNKDDHQNFSHFLTRRLNAEVLHDGLDQLTLSKPSFPGVPDGTRAVQLPDAAFDSYLLTVFGRPDATSPCECERSNDVTLAQMLHLMNSHEVLAKIGTGLAVKTPPPKKGPAPKKMTPGLRAANLAKDKRPHEDRIREAFLAAYSRTPRPEESKLLVEHIARSASVQSAYEDILWALVNSEEFLFNR